MAQRIVPGAKTPWLTRFLSEDPRNRYYMYRTDYAGNDYIEYGVHPRNDSLDLTVHRQPMIRIVDDIAFGHHLWSWTTKWVPDEHMWLKHGRVIMHGNRDNCDCPYRVPVA